MLETTVLKFAPIVFGIKATAKPHREFFYLFSSSDPPSDQMSRVCISEMFKSIKKAGPTHRLDAASHRWNMI